MGITGLVQVVKVTHRSAEEKGDRDRVQEEKPARETQKIRDYALRQECWRLAGDRPGRQNWN